MKNGASINMDKWNCKVDGKAIPETLPQSNALCATKINKMTFRCAPRKRHTSTKSDLSLLARWRHSARNVRTPAGGQLKGS